MIYEFEKFISKISKTLTSFLEDVKLKTDDWCALFPTHTTSLTITCDRLRSAIRDRLRSFAIIWKPALKQFIPDSKRRNHKPNQKEKETF